MQPALPPQKPAAAPPAAEARGHHQHQGAVPHLGERGASGAPQGLLKAEDFPGGGQGGSCPKDTCNTLKEERNKKKKKKFITCWSASKPIVQIGGKTLETKRDKKKIHGFYFSQLCETKRKIKLFRSYCI